MDRASPRGGLPAALPLPNHRAPPPRNDRMKYLPVYLFVGFITLILIVLPFIARDESQKIYLPGALEKKLLQKAERIHKKIQAALQTLKIRAAAEHIPPKTLISAQEAIARYGDRPGSQIADNYDDDSAPVLIYHGDLTLNGDLNSAWLQQQAAELHAAAYRNHIIIDGNLTLQGALLDDAALNLSVSGNVQADYLHSADGHLEILGDLDSALGISDSPDYIHIESGDIGYHPANFDGSQKIPLDDSISGGNNGWFWYYYKHSAKMLRPENYERGKFSPAQFLALVRNGENPFIPVPPPKKTQT